MGAIRVLVVDDSVVIRKVLSEALASVPGIEVVGMAADGSIALSKIPLLHPDLITLDVEMPGMSGLETLSAIRKAYSKLPVIMFSTLTERGASITLEALSLGASDYVTKPQNSGSVDETRARIRSDLIPKVKELCSRHSGMPPANPPSANGRPALANSSPATSRVYVVAIGTSTGGPNALAALLPLLPADFPVPVVIVVSYADFITLLFAFFVILYSSSQVDKRKVGRLALAIQSPSRNSVSLILPTPRFPSAKPSPCPLPISRRSKTLNAAEIWNASCTHEGVLTSAAANASLSDVQAQLEKALAPEIKDHFVDVQMRKEGVVVSLREMGFYDSGSATMLPSAMNAVDRLAAVIAPRNESLRIEGHTDNIPIHNAHFPSNWELSTARATELVQLFIYRYHVMPSRLSAAGYAEFHPVADNGTAEGRSRNPRIDIVILNPVLVERSPILSPGPAVNPLSGPANSKTAPSPGARPSGR
jgi:flagellar motor protein MotB/CheY-like chemotaxis protein